MVILCLGLIVFVGLIFTILILSLCAAAKKAERKMMYVTKNFPLTEYQQEMTWHEKSGHQTKRADLENLNIRKGEDLSPTA